MHLSRSSWQWWHWCRKWWHWCRNLWRSSSQWFHNQLMRRHRSNKWTLNTGNLHNKILALCLIPPNCHVLSTCHRCHRCRLGNVDTVAYGRLRPLANMQCLGFGARTTFRTFKHIESAEKVRNCLNIKKHTKMKKKVYHMLSQQKT